MASVDSSPQTLDPNAPSDAIRRRRTKTLSSTSDDDAQSSSVAPEDGAESAPQSAPLESFTDFIISAVFFQVNLFINVFLFPLHFLSFCFRVATDPLGTLKLMAVRVRDGYLGQIVLKVYEGLGMRQGAGNMAASLVWWWLRLLYVFAVLCGLLVAAFVCGRMVMGRVVEEPLRVERELNFDYTKAKPDATVVVGSGDGLSGFDDGIGVDCKLRATVSLVLPESEYNKKLGMFQVRMEFLSANSKVLSSSSLPCMLRFKSSHMLLIETILRSVPLLSGYSSEAQVIRVKMSGFSNRTEPIAFLRVVLEQRAEFSHGAGIPEIYSASAKLESELPFFKQIIWSWRRTVFMWVTLMIFISELLAVLLCCWPIIIPTSRPRSL